MTELSPAAQAVMIAYWKAEFEESQQNGVAAALRAAADQLGYRILYDNDDIDYRLDVADLLAIAAELEGQS